MSRAPKPSTWTPPTSPEVEVKLEKASTKERTLSPEFVSASARDSRSKDNTPATTTTIPLTPRSTPASKNMSTFEPLQTLRRCDGTASNGSQCVTERKTGYPDDIPFFCKKHIKQADSYAASSPIIPTPAASPEVESRDKDSVQDQGEEIHQDDQSRSGDTMGATLCSGVRTNGESCRIKASKKHLLGTPFFCHHHISQMPMLSGPTPAPAIPPKNTAAPATTLSLVESVSSPPPSSKTQTCGGVTSKDKPCKNRRSASSRSDQPYYCNLHREQSKSMDGVILELDVAEASPPFASEQTSSSSSSSTTAPRQPSRRIKKDPENALAAPRLDEPKVEQSLPISLLRQTLRSRAPVEVPRLSVESPMPAAPPVAPSSSSVPGVQQCNGRTVRSAQCNNKSAKTYNSPDLFYCHLHKTQAV